MLEAAFGAIATRHLEATDPANLALWTLRGQEALEPGIDASRRDRVLRLASATGGVAEYALGTTSASAAEATAALLAHAAATSPALARRGLDAMLRAGFEEVFNHLDPYSRYLTAEDAQEARERRMGHPGLGIGFAEGPGGSLLISSVAPGSPAARARLRAGDRLLAIEGYGLDAAAMASAARMLDGPEGSTVRLSVQRGRTRFAIRLRRTFLVPDSVASELRDGVLFVRINAFSSATGTQLAEALRAGLRGEGVAGVVLDLRGNRGGLLQQAISVADLLIPAGTVALTDGRHPDARRRWEAAGDDLAGGRPLVVLVDGRTASAAEVVAAALSDRGRGVVVGSATMGKGLIQILVPLPNGAELSVSWSRILAPAGWPLQALGVLPALCTSLGAEATARGLAALESGQPPMAVPLARQRAARAPVPASEVAALRDSCPPAEGREGDLLAARGLLGRPDAYRAALRR